MTRLHVILLGIGLAAASGLPAFLLPRRSSRGQWLTAMIMVAGCGCGLGGTVAEFARPATLAMELPWLLPLGRGTVGLDVLGAVFLLPVFAIGALCTLYGLGYWPQAEHPENGRGLGLAIGLLVAGMGMVVLARNAVIFLMAWEIMAVAAFFAATAEDHESEVRQAGWVYLVATHLGTAFLLALFTLLHWATDSFALVPVASGVLGATTASAIFCLALVGFGFKAGFMPLHVWLPGAHANAPSHVSALLSGVMLKMGIYGIVRITANLPDIQPWWGGTLLAVGGASAVLGIVFAVAQNDIKRLLAYSSIENMGIVGMGLGLALLGRGIGRPDLVVLGLGGALLHVWNHSLFKPLLFLNAGAVIHATRTRDMNRLGGLAKGMPWTAAIGVLGAVAICGLPPLNGFAGEWLLYLGFFQEVGTGGADAAGSAAAVGGVALAMTGALALACFVKFVGMVFLGVPRDATAGKAHEPRRICLIPMAILAGSCLVLGMVPQLIFPVLSRVAQAWNGPHAVIPELAALAPAEWLTSLAATLLILALAGYLVLRRRIRRQPGQASVSTWGCGYLAATSRMQYTGTSFSEMLTTLFCRVLWPRRHLPGHQGLFAAKARFSHAVPDTVLDRLTWPAFRITGQLMAKLRLLQQGVVQIYLLYIFVIVFLLFFLGFAG